LKGKSTVKSKKFKEEVEPGLLNFFETVVLPLSGPRPTRAMAEESGAVMRDSEDTLELDPEWMKRRLLGKYCFNLGYSVKQSASGAVKIDGRVDEEWVASGAKNEPYCSLTTFWNYWKRNPANIIVCVNLAKTFAVFAINFTLEVGGLESEGLTMVSNQMTKMMMRPSQPKVNDHRLKVSELREI
jgi:hypothetical protein